MTILVETHYECNLSCRYCYNREFREKERRYRAGSVRINREVIEPALREAARKGVSKEACLHGGEPLLLPLEDLEWFFRLCRELGLRPSVMTNGTLLEEEHIVLFRKYGVGVGVSIDGYWDCNRYRMNKEMTEELVQKIFWLKDSGVSVGVITVVSRANVGRERRDLMKKFVSDFSERGITGRLNPVVHDDPEVKPRIEEYVDFYSDMAEWMLENGIWGWSPFSDIIDSLKGSRNRVVCVFHGCFPLVTPSAYVIKPDGSIGVCYRRGGLDVQRAEHRFIPVREWVLYHTECRGCKWFWHCLGGCPRTGIGGDWRRKTELCPVWRKLFEFYERVLKHVGVSVSSGETDLFRRFGW